MCTSNKTGHKFRVLWGGRVLSWLGLGMVVVGGRQVNERPRGNKGKCSGRRRICMWMEEDGEV